MHHDDATDAPGAIYSQETAQTMLNLATPETVKVFRVLERQMEAAAAGGATDLAMDYMRACSRLLLIDLLYQDQQAIIAHSAGLHGDALATYTSALCPNGEAPPEDDDLHRRLSNTVTFLGTLAGTDLRDVIDRVRRIQQAAAREPEPIIKVM